MKYLFSSVLILLFFNCDPQNDYKLKIQNNTNSPVFFYYTTDSTLTEYNPFLKGTIDKYYIEPNGTKSAVRHHSKWEATLITLPDSSINIFIFQDSIPRKYDWKTIKRNKLWHKRYHLSLAELKRMDWLVTYDVK